MGSESVRATRRASRHQLRFLHCLQTNPQRYRLHGFQSRRISRPQLRQHPRRRPLPHAPRRFQKCRSRHAATSRRQRPQRRPSLRQRRYLQSSENRSCLFRSPRHLDRSLARHAHPRHRSLRCISPAAGNRLALLQKAPHCDGISVGILRLARVHSRRRHFRISSEFHFAQSRRHARSLDRASPSRANRFLVSRHRAAGFPLAARIPGLSYIFLVATCAAALAGLLLIFRPKSASLAAILPLAVSAIVGFPLALLLYQGFGARALPLIAVLAALLLSPLAPLFADVQRARGLSLVALPWLAGATMLLASFAAIVVPAFSAKAPEHVNLEYVQEADSGNSQWVVYPASGHLPEPIRLATNFRAQESGAFPWIPDPAFFAAAPHVEVAPPPFTILESSELFGKRRYRTLLRSERGASEALLMFPPDSRIESVVAADEPLQPQTEKVRQYQNGWYAYDFYAMPAKGVEVSFTLPVGKPVPVYVLDITYALPLEGLFLLKSRPLTANSFGEGDCTIASRRVQLLP